MRRQVITFLKRALNPQPDARAEWPRILPAAVSIGSGTRLAGAQLRVEDANGCALNIGAESNIEGALIFEKSGAQINVGARTHIGGGALIDAACRIEIGDDVLVGFDVLLMDHDSHSLRFAIRRNDVRGMIEDTKNWTDVRMSPIDIHNKAWIGARAIILRGVTIGEGSIVAAGSVVTKSIPPWSIAAGNPARVVRVMTKDEREFEQAASICNK
jgi:acetyltransferase-like isoleucine patch superfamily enzyme